MAGEEELQEQDGCSASSFDVTDAEFLAACLALITLMGSAISYFWQRKQERKEQKECDRKEAADLDRQQALERVRNQLSVFVGPLHRHWKTQNTILSQYRKRSGDASNRIMTAIQQGGRAHWMTLFPDEQMNRYIDDPISTKAKEFRHMVSRRLKPIYTKIRQLILMHASDLADMPTQQEWLEKYDRDTITSPYLGSLNVNVILDSYTTWTLECDDIIQSWEEGDFDRMQPTTMVAWIICNDLVDLLYDTAKGKEAKYNKHVKVHRNTIQQNGVEAMWSKVTESTQKFTETTQGPLNQPWSAESGHY